MAADYEVFLTYQGRSVIARSRDISPRGVGVLADENLAPGETVTVLVIVPQATLNAETRGTVRYGMANPIPTRPAVSAPGSNSPTTSATTWRWLVRSAASTATPPPIRFPSRPKPGNATG